VHGGFVLLVGGIAMTALACVYASSPAVAPIFAVFGAVLLICAAFYSRIEGNLRAGREGVSFGVSAAQRASRHRKLPPDLALEAISETVQALNERAAPTAREAEAIAEKIVANVATDARERHDDLLDQFSLWLMKEEGFRRYSMSPPQPFDFVAERDQDLMLVEVKTGRRPIMPDVVARLKQAIPPDAAGRRVRRALVVASGHPIATTAVDLVASSEGQVEIYELWPNGDVKRVI
jgi:hypothetical protein